MKIKKGELIVLTSGEYSDFIVETVCIAVDDLDLNKLEIEFLETHTKEGCNHEEDFIKWIVVDKRLVVELPYKEVNVGTYGDVKLKINEEKITWRDLACK